jgi:hypothetical protein
MTVSYPITIKRISASNNVTVNTTASQTIDGAASKVLGSQWATITVQSNGSNWCSDQKGAAGCRGAACCALVAGRPAKERQSRY